MLRADCIACTLCAEAVGVLLNLLCRKEEVFLSNSIRFPWVFGDRIYESASAAVEGETSMLVNARKDDEAFICDEIANLQKQGVKVLLRAPSWRFLTHTTASEVSGQRYVFDEPNILHELEPGSFMRESSIRLLLRVAEMEHIRALANEPMADTATWRAPKAVQSVDG